jgi:hypothetical protein
MDKEKIIDIANNSTDKSNKDLLDAELFLYEEYEKTKTIAVELTKHMEAIEELYNKIVSEIEKRKGS